MRDVISFVSPHPSVWTPKHLHKLQSQYLLLLRCASKGVCVYSVSQQGEGQPEDSLLPLFLGPLSQAPMPPGAAGNGLPHRTREGQGPWSPGGRERELGFIAGFSHGWFCH